MDILVINTNFTVDSTVNGPLLSSFSALIMVIAFFTNFFVIAITFCNKSKSWKHPSTIFLTSLLLGDLVLVVFVMPFSVITGAYGEWIFGQSAEEKYRVCQFAAFMLWYSALLITTTLTLISLDRFLFIVKPLFYRRHIYMKPQIAVTVVIIDWIVCAILNTTPLYGLGLFYFAGSGFCIPGWEEQLGYVIFTMLIFAILVGCIVVTSLWTCCSTHNYFRRAEKRNIINEMEENIYKTKKKQVIGIFGALLLMTMICFAPMFIMGFLSLFLITPSVVYTIVTVNGYVITVSNPLVQVLFRQDLKATLERLYSTKCGLNNHASTSTDHNDDVYLHK